MTAIDDSGDGAELKLWQAKPKLEIGYVIWFNDLRLVGAPKKKKKVDYPSVMIG